MNTKRVMLQLALILTFVVCARGQERLVEVRERAKPYEPAIVAASQRYAIDAHLLWTIAYLESRFKSNAISYKDGKPCARGLMQFIPTTAQRYGLKDPHNSANAIEAAARYVRDLQLRFGARRDLILAAYNAGEGTVEAFRDGKRLLLSNVKVINPNLLRTDGVPPYQETKQYVANGRIVYQQISREKLYAGPESVRGSMTSPPRHTEKSIYSLSNESQPLGAKLQKSTTTHSVYPY